MNCIIFIALVEVRSLIVEFSRAYQQNILIHNNNTSPVMNNILSLSCFLIYIKVGTFVCCVYM